MHTYLQHIVRQIYVHYIKYIFFGANVDRHRRRTRRGLAGDTAALAALLVRAAHATASPRQPCRPHPHLLRQARPPRRRPRGHPPSSPPSPLRRFLNCPHCRLCPARPPPPCPLPPPSHALRRRPPNDFTLPCLNKSASSLRAAATAAQLHSLPLKLGLMPDPFVACGDVDMYCKLASFPAAQKLLDNMPHGSVAAWNALISNSVVAGDGEGAISAFLLLRRGGGDPNSITFYAVLKACADSKNLRAGRKIHGFISKFGFDGNVNVENGLVDFYGKCGCVGEGVQVFDRIDGVRRNEDSWCSVAYVENDE